MSRKQYKSAPTRLARLFESSRDRWKQRAAQKQRTIRAQRVTIRDLKGSRDYWKAHALEAARELTQLRAAATVPGVFSAPVTSAEPACLGGP